MTYLCGTVFDEETRCSLQELCRFCGVNAETVRAMINEGLITPCNPTSFTYLEVRRVQTAVRLQRDLRINLPGCALALDLLEELEELRQQRNR